jgi:hypothetical protein
MTVLSTTTQNDRRSERGNVLFLILIAVALFAALSYAVTQSTRSGGGDASKETNLVNAAGITQYPASIKTAITRMVISNSVETTKLLFDTPSTFGTLADTDKPNAVFYPTGGGANYVEAPASVMDNVTGTWHFNGENQVENIGTYDTTTDSTNADIIAFLPNVKQAVCESIHSKLGLSIVPLQITNTGGNIDITTDMDLANPGIGAGGNIINAPALVGQPQGCFIQGGKYIYYHVVAER